MKCLFIILTLLVLSCSSTQSKPTSINNQIIGTWMSTEDTLFKVAFTDSLKIDYYDKDIASTSIYSISADTVTAIDKETKEIFRYSISSLTDSTLSLIYLDRGNTLMFKRMSITK